MTDSLPDSKLKLIWFLQIKADETAMAGKIESMHQDLQWYRCRFSLYSCRKYLPQRKIVAIFSVLSIIMALSLHQMAIFVASEPKVVEPVVPAPWSSIQDFFVARTHVAHMFVDLIRVCLTCADGLNERAHAGQGG